MSGSLSHHKWSQAKRAGAPVCVCMCVRVCVYVYVCLDMYVWTFDMCCVCLHFKSATTQAICPLHQTLWLGSKVRQATHTHTNTHTHARAHAHTHARTHTHLNKHIQQIPVLQGGWPWHLEQQRCCWLLLCLLLRLGALKRPAC